MNFKGYKKVNEDKDFTTLRHYEGHEIRIAHNKLPKHQKEALKALPNKGPHVTKAEKAAQSANVTPGEAHDQRKLSMAQTADAQGKKANVAAPGPMMAQGGEVVEMGKKRQAPEPQPTQTPTPAPDNTPIGKRIGFPGFAEGGQVPEGQTLGDKIGYPKMMKDGGDPADQSIPVAVPGQQPMIPEALANPTPGSQAGPMPGQPGPADPTSQIVGGEAQPYGMSGEQVAQMQAPNTQAVQGMGQVAQAQVADASGQPPAPGADPWGVNAYSDAYMKGMDEQKAGLNQEAVAQEQMGNAQAKVLQQHVGQVQQQAADYQNHYNTLDTERKAFMQDLANQKIDANRVWNDRSAFGKVSTALGLLIGGLTFNGQNGAMDFFNKQIDRDIESQKMDMEKKNTLLGANMKQFGNLRDATDMTRLMMLDTVSHQLQQMAAKAQGPIARARALQGVGQIDKESGPIASQIAMRRTLIGGANAGTIAPETIVRMIVPEHQQAGTYKELKEAQDTTKFRDNLLGAFDQLSKINTMAGAIGSPIQTPKQVNAIKQPLTAALSKNTAGRFTEQDAGMLETLWPSKGDNAETIQTKRNALMKLAEEKMNFPMLKAYGIQIPGSGRYGMDGQKRIKLGAPVR